MTPLSSNQLASYLRRIGHSGPVGPDLATFRALHRRHPEALAFENLDSFTGTRVAIDLPDVYAKLVERGRGGYCFEQNTLFAAALEALGFEVRRLAARVLWDLGPDAPVPLSHMVLHVVCEGVVYLADTGFGRLSLSAPLLLDHPGEQRTPHEIYQIDREPSGYSLRSFVGGAWRSLYRYTLEPAHECDYLQMNWFVSTHPDSRFVRNLIAARIAGRQRNTLLNNRLTIRHDDGRTEQRIMASGAELRACLESEFALCVPRDDRIDARLQALSEQR